MAKKITNAVFFALIVFCFTGCAVKRSSYDVPAVPLPANYKNSLSIALPTTDVVVAQEGESLTSSVTQREVGLIEWWRSFRNSELVELVDRGLANNPDLRIATLRMAQAKTRLDQARAGMLPSISAPFGTAIQAPGGSIGSVPVGASDRKSQKSFQASLRGNFRVDIWGEQGSLVESALFQLWQAAFERDNVQRNIVANIVSGYVGYLSLNDRLRIARETEAVLDATLVTITKRVAAGDATLIELDQQKASVFAARAAIPNLEQQREDAHTSIAFLVGTVPSSLILSSDGLDTIDMPGPVPALPSSLLLHRPDVRMAEARLLAADADVDVARARILPPLDLSAQVGRSSLLLSQFFQPSSLFWNALVNLTANIFDGGKLASQTESSQKAHEEMVENYARTIYQAVREVETALTAIRSNESRIEAQQNAATSARRAWDRSAEVYAVGGLDYQALLDAERSYHRYLDEYQRIRLDRFHGYINLLQALGGGIDFSGTLPGQGKRPDTTQSAVQKPVLPTRLEESRLSNVFDWVGSSSAEDGGILKTDEFWQVELTGLYHRSTIGPTWRDLRARYPKLMENRGLRPRLDGKIEDGVNTTVSWYRLYVSRFSKPDSAHELCSALQENFQRCRVVSSRSGESVPAPKMLQKKTESPVKITSDNNAATGIIFDENSLDAAIPLQTAKSPAGERHFEPPATSSSASEPKSPPSDASSPPDISADTAKAHSNARNRLVYAIQIGAFSSLNNASASQAFWRAKEYAPYISETKDAKGQTWYVVRQGQFSRRGDAVAAISSFQRNEGVLAILKSVLVNR